MPGTASAPMGCAPGAPAAAVAMPSISARTPPWTSVASMTPRGPSISLAGWRRAWPAGCAVSSASTPSNSACAVRAVLRGPPAAERGRKRGLSPAGALDGADLREDKRLAAYGVGVARPPACDHERPLRAAGPEFRRSYRRPAIHVSAKSPSDWRAAGST